RLINAWPAIIPPGPGVLCAYGDATTRLRNESSQTYVTPLAQTRDSSIFSMLESMQKDASASLSAEGVGSHEQQTLYEIDIRYIGQGMKLTIGLTPEEFASEGLAGVARRFDAEHEKLFTFALEAEHELVGLRAVVQGMEKVFVSDQQEAAGTDSSAARTQPTRIFSDGGWCEGYIYERSRLKPANRIAGPAVVTEMDSTSVILPDHVGIVDSVGNIIIWPASHPNAQ
ncbi:MAG: hypothetical protein AB8B63_10290, partial [Granulosicoccus sp.]